MTLRVDIKLQLGAFLLQVDFTAPLGATVLFGPSGCGKSSIIHAIAGLIRPEHGQIICANRRLYDSAAGINLPPHRRRLGVIFQDARLFPHLTVQQNLVYGRRFSRPDTAQPSLQDVCDLLGIGPLLPRRPAALSGGEAARVAIGRALLSAPDMILADEPLAALDEQRRGEILPYFTALRDAALVPMVYVTHSVAEVARLATTVVALQNGRIMAQGSADVILGRADIMGAGASSLLAATVTRHHPDGLSEFATMAGAVFVPQISAAVGSAHLLRIAAQDVILSRSAPLGLSALNILNGTICEITTTGNAVMITLHAREAKIRARVTQRSAQAMGLEMGQTCYAIVKSVALAQAL